MLDVTFSSAFLAGLISFISPCVLPIVPPYIAYLAGISFSELSSGHSSPEISRRIIGSSILFVLGFTTVFVLLGASATVVGQTFTEYFDVLATLAGIIIIIMGLHFLGVFRIGLLHREARIQIKKKPTNIWSSYLMGLAFAFGWTPCVGPFLTGILLMAGAENTAWHGAALLATYSLGIGIPFILAAVFARQFIGWAANFKLHLGKVEKGMGAMLVLTGLLFLTGAMPKIATWLLETFPAFANYG